MMTMTAGTQTMMQEMLKSDRPFWEIKNKTETSADLFIYASISSYPWDGEVSAKNIIDDLKAIGSVNHLNIHINSPGGTVTEGMAIKAYLARQKYNKTVYIEGLCASIATAIAFGIGAEVHMDESALVMIHNAWAIVGGNAADMRKYADELDKNDQNILQIYTARCGDKISAEELQTMMAEETWLSASECLDYGFVDYIESNAMHAAACLPKAYHDFYKHVPDAVSAADGGDPKSTTSTVSDEKAKAIIEKANAVLEEYHYRKEHEKYAKHN